MNTAARTCRGRRRLGIRSVLLLAVLLPVLGMTASAIAAGGEAREKRDVAQQVQDEVMALTRVIDTRTALGDEFAQTAVVAVAADLGVDIDRLTELYETDYRVTLAAARTKVDADPVLDSEPSLADTHAQVLALRRDVDAATATFDEVRAAGTRMNQAVLALAGDRLLAIRDLLLRNDVAGTMNARSDALWAAVEVVGASTRRAELAIRLIRADPEAGLLEALLDETTRQRTATERLLDRAGADLTMAARELRDPAVRRFEIVLDEVAHTSLAGEPSPLAEDLAAFGAAFVDGDRWASRLQDLVLAAVDDLEEEAIRYQERVSLTLRGVVVRAAVPAGLAVIVALLLARNVSRPARRLEAAALSINQGRFALGPIPTTGPRELSDVATAFNEMAVTLAAVEAQAIALAEDPDADHLTHRLPGRTGLALESALDRLRTSMRKAEESRRELEHTATHDGLTGLLTRSTAYTMIDRDLAHVARSGGSVMALFVDLDDFKVINDRYGHAAGDEALLLTAEAVRASTRAADMVARLGGDELLVTGIASGPEEVEAIAERIRRAVVACEITMRSRPTSLRCSIGMALDVGGMTTADALIGRADAAMYEAKRLGGNRAVWADPQTLRPDVATAGV